MALAKASRRSAAANAPPPVGRFYDVGGRRLLLHRSGEGSPAVVFLPGAGTFGIDYLGLQQRAAQLTTSILYDRAGTGWSDRAKLLGRTGAEVSEELRDLLEIAGVPPPYVLVGHSLGGLYARQYAQRFPHDVAGLVLLDPAHEDYNAYMPERLNAMRGISDPGAPTRESLVSLARKQLGRLLVRAMSGVVRNRFAQGVLLRLPIVRRYRVLYRGLIAQEMGADWPEAFRELLVERHISLQWLWTGIEEALNAEPLYDEVRRGGPLPDVPLIILCSMATDEFRRAVSVGEDESLLREEIEGKRRL
jgi:pimeloyl-ACP methyl ester carboxylesterase